MSKATPGGGISFSIPYLTVSPSVTERMNKRIPEDPYERDALRTALFDESAWTEVEAKEMSTEVAAEALTAFRYKPNLSATQVASDRDACITALRQLEVWDARVEKGWKEVEVACDETVSSLKKEPPAKPVVRQPDYGRMPFFFWLEFGRFAGAIALVLGWIVAIAMGAFIGFLTYEICGLIFSGLTLPIWLLVGLIILGIALAAYEQSSCIPTIGWVVSFGIGALVGLGVYLLCGLIFAEVPDWIMICLMLLLGAIAAFGNWEISDSEELTCFSSIAWCVAAPVGLPVWLVANLIYYFYIKAQKVRYEAKVRELKADYQRRVDEANEKYRQASAAYERAWQAGAADRRARAPLLRNKIYRAVFSYDVARVMWGRAAEVVGLSERYSDRKVRRAILEILLNMEAVTFSDAAARLEERTRAEARAAEQYRHNRAMEAEARRKNEEQKRHNEAVEAEQQRQYEEQRKAQEARQREIDRRLDQIADEVESASRSAADAARAAANSTPSSYDMQRLIDAVNRLS